jgi:acetyl esterase/lipase
MRALLRSLACLLAVPATAAAQSEPLIVPLWRDGAPGFESRKDEPEVAKDWWVRNVHNPSLTVFLPPPNKATGTAVVVAPGGGFRELVFNAEGVQAAQFLNSIGVAAFALKYRLPEAEGSPYTMKNVQQDAYRAVRLVRSRAQEWGVDPGRVGMLGFSAGGAVVAQVAYTSGAGNPRALDPIDRLNGRPDFQMLVYPGGQVPDVVPPDTPSAFLLVGLDDGAGCDEVTLALFGRLLEAGVPVEAHFLAHGQHAFNMGDRSSLRAVRHWPERLADWMSDNGWLGPREKRE